MLRGEYSMKNGLRHKRGNYWWLDCLRDLKFPWLSTKISLNLILTDENRHLMGWNYHIFRLSSHQGRHHKFRKSLINNSSTVRLLNQRQLRKIRKLYHQWTTAWVHLHCAFQLQPSLNYQRYRPPEVSRSSHIIVDWITSTLRCRCKPHCINPNQLSSLTKRKVSSVIGYLNPSLTMRWSKSTAHRKSRWILKV